MARRWHHRRARRARVSSAHILLGAGAIGALAGIGSIGTTPEGRAQLYNVASDASVAAGLARERAPQAGDDWRRCDDARAAGTASTAENRDIGKVWMPTTTASPANRIAASSAEPI